MEPERRSFRLYSRIVAIIQLILGIFWILVFIYGFVSFYFEIGEGISTIAQMIGIYFVALASGGKEVAVNLKDGSGSTLFMNPQNNAEIMDNDTPLHYEGENPNDDNFFEIGVFLVVLIAPLIITIKGAISAEKLINATKLGQDPVVAAKQARMWRNSTTICTIWILVLVPVNWIVEQLLLRSIISGTGAIIIALLINHVIMRPICTGPGSVIAIISLLMQLIGIWIVHSFIQELDNRTPPTSSTEIEFRYIMRRLQQDARYSRRTQQNEQPV